MNPPAASETAAAEAEATAGAARTLLADAVDVARDAGRDDLLARLNALTARLRDPVVRILIVGEFKQGKSSLVNGLLGEPICPVDDDIATSVPTVVGYADTPTAVALTVDGSGEGAVHRETLDVADVAIYASETGNPDNERGLLAVEVGLPHRLLREGLVLVDTPGVGGLGSRHSAMTVRALPSADAIVLVSDASQALTEPELSFLDLARDLTSTILLALTKTDLYPQWRQVAAHNVTHLHGRGITAPILPVSAALRQHALAVHDADLHRESGYPDLLETLQRDVAGRAARSAQRDVAHHVATVAHSVAQPLATERTMLTDPDSRARLTAELTAAHDHVASLQAGAARWQHTLADGITDLATDAEADLRARVRALRSSGAASIAATDPNDVWEQFAHWLHDGASRALASNWQVVMTGAGALGERVAADVAEASEAAPTVEVSDPRTPLHRIDPLSALQDEERDFAGKAITGIGGGFLALQLVSTVGGLLPIAGGIVWGAAFGATALLTRRTLREDSARARAERRAQAMQALDRFLEEFAAESERETQMTLSRIERSLRDTFTTRVEELRRSAAASVAAAEQTLDTADDARADRIEEIDTALDRLSHLARRAEGLAAGTGEEAQA